MNKIRPYYDQIGSNYSKLRKPDRRIQSQISSQLAADAKILNVGAGTGSYEPLNKHVIAVEPSEIMIRQRPHNAAPVVKASAESLPFVDKQFDWAMALLTIHHWDNWELGLEELKRTSKKQLIFTWNPDHPGFWLTQEYFPEVLKIDKSIFPKIPEMRKIFDKVEIIPIPIPFDCSDGFGSAYWRRPEALLSQEVRSAISTFNKIQNVETGLLKLRADLESGEWNRKYGDILGLTELDLGFCLVVSK